MGIVSGILVFGLGYAAGTKIGDRPIQAYRRTAADARARGTSLLEAAGRVGSRIGGVSGRTVDVRQVREVMTAAPETVTPETTLRDAAALMERMDIGNVLVVDNDELRGIVTDRDIAVRAVAKGLSAAKTPVREVFTPSAVSVSPTSTVQEAIELMREHDIRRVPVVESGVPVGIVSLGDLAASHEPRSLLADISKALPNN
jgi:CBS domain-containing protein